MTGVKKGGKLKIKKHTHDSGASLLSQQSPKSFEIGDYLFISWPHNLTYKLKLRSPYIARLKQAKNYQGYCLDLAIASTSYHRGTSERHHVRCHVVL